MLDFTINKIFDSISSSIMQESTRQKLKKEINIYIINTYEKFRLTKNLLFRNEPIDFYDNYLKLNLNEKNKNTRYRNPIEVLNNFNKIVILGNAGSGKSTLLKFITLNFIKSDTLIPIYIELRLFGNQKNDFETFVINTISQQFNNEIKELFHQGRFVFLFDGFDEINFIEGENTISQIQNFISNFYKNSFIITSRPGTNIESLNEFHVYDLAPLNENDIISYVEKLQISNSKKELFFESIENDTYFHQYLTTPLFLSIYIDYIINNNLSSIPKNKTIFFRNIIDTLFSKHDAVSKLGFVRTKLSGLNKDQLESVSTILAFRALLTSSNTFSKDILIKELELIKRNQSLNFENDKLIYDLTITVNILLVAGDYYSFAHILILEYLASIFIARLPLNQKNIFYKKVLFEDKILLSTSLLNFLFELDMQMFMREFLIPKIETSSGYEIRNSSIIIKEFLSQQFNYSDESLFGKRQFLNKLKIEYRINDQNDLDELFML